MLADAWAGTSLPEWDSPKSLTMRRVKGKGPVMNAGPFVRLVDVSR
jgi:hypothetical protein